MIAPLAIPVRTRIKPGGGASLLRSSLQYHPPKPQQHETHVSNNDVSRISVSSNGDSSYHGRTSALFDENWHERPTKAARSRLPDALIEQGLVANALRQRQLEDVNLRSGQLDFDGLDPELGLHLLSLHWNRQHHSFLITYRPAFMRDMACKGPYFSKLLLNAIYFGASKFSPRHEVRKDPEDVRTAGWKFRERVRQLLGSALDHSDITTIQALLVMTNSLFALGDERGAAWLYAGLAFRMIVDLGMHVDVVDLTDARKLSDEDLEIRRRVFWGAFVVDKIQSLYQGRPATLKESDTLVPIKFLDTYEELENWSPFAYSTQSHTYSGSPAFSISTFKSLCSLSVVMSDILSTIYAERSFDQSPPNLSRMLEKLDNKLTSWRESLAPHLGFDATKDRNAVPPPHVLSLHAMYYVLVILLHRPFVADGHLYSALRSVSVNSFIACANAASSIVHLLRAYDRVFSVRRAPYLISYATYVAATINVRIAAKRRHDPDALSNVETCLAVFCENQATNWAVRRANSVIRNLMKRLGVVIDESHTGLRIANDVERLQQSRPETTEGQVVRIITAPAVDNLTGNAVNEHGSHVDMGSSDTRWVDIDGIIQSFLRDQGGTSQTYDTVEPVLFPGQNFNLSAVDPQQIPFITQPGLRSARRTRGTDQESVDEIPSNQQMAVNSSFVSMDDPLFGFNGSGLDDLDGFEWTQS
ncbi:fungal specific transcription factor domain-containing protein [Seiridium cupressi]